MLLALVTALWFLLFLPACSVLIWMWAKGKGRKPYYSTPYGLEPGLSPEVSLPFYNQARK